MICLNLMSTCCEGKSDLAEIKCQNDILNITTALKLYKASQRLWTYKCSLLKYVCHTYLDSGNAKLFDAYESPDNVSSLKELIELVSEDMTLIHNEWQKED